MSDESSGVQKRQFSLFSPTGGFVGSMLITFSPLGCLAGERVYTSNASGLIDVVISMKPTEFAQAVGNRDIKDHRPQGRMMGDSMKADTVTIHVQSE